jgi:hypothetical protein
MLSMVAHGCNFRYSEVGDWENCSLRSVLAKKLVRPFSTKKARHGGV